MKRHLFLLVAAVLLYVPVRAKTNTNILKNYKYETITQNNAVAEISATEDSLIITFTKENSPVTKDLYQLVGQDTQGPYILAYVKMDASSLSMVTPSGSSPLRQPLFGVFVFHFEKEDGKLMVLHDGRLWLTAEEAKAAYSKIWLPDEYFNTWYAEPRFNRFIQYPELKDADLVTVEKVALYWVHKIQEHKRKKQNTINGDKSGADYLRDNLTKVLVNYRLSPMATAADLSNKFKQYGLNIAPKNQAPQKPRQQDNKTSESEL